MQTGMYCVLFATADEVVSGCETCRQLRAAVGLPPGEQNNDTQTQTVQVCEAELLHGYSSLVCIVHHAAAAIILIDVG